MTATTVALIPTYQPDERLLGLLASLRDRNMARVVVDDGSGDRFLPLFQQATGDAIVLSYGVNQGKGHALKLGMRYIAEHFPVDAVVVTVDADGQHSADDALRCAQAATADDRSLVLGCRTFGGRSVPLRSRLGNGLTRMMYRLASGTRVSDTQTGLRAFSVGLIDFMLGIAGERYEYEMNVLLACPRHDVGIREVPIRTIYEENNASSHFRPVVDSVRIYAGILAFALSSFASFLLDVLLFWALVRALGVLGVGGVACVAAANVLARAVSATANFALNRTLVFGSDAPLTRSALRYVLLAAAILALNTGLLGVLVGLLGMPALPAKVLVESCLFVASWVLQSRYVFR